MTKRSLVSINRKNDECLCVFRYTEGIFDVHAEFETVNKRVVALECLKKLDRMLGFEEVAEFDSSSDYRVRGVRLARGLNGVIHVEVQLDLYAIKYNGWFEFSHSFKHAKDMLEELKERLVDWIT